MIDSLRDNLAHRVAAKWKDLFKLTLSFADGSSARVSAINAALKPYRFVLNLLQYTLVLCLIAYVTYCCCTKIR